MTVPLIYGLLLKQCSLSPTHYEFTFTYITACILHTNVQKRRKEVLCFCFLCVCGGGEGGGSADCFCPLADVLYPKKGDTDLNVKVSTVNHHGGAAG